MSCVEKRHMSHRMGGMLHHRFPNGFSDVFMDETDREVSTLTDRAFRSLCVGDDAVYNDELLYGYSPFSCHKPLAGEPKKAHKESKKQGQNKNHAQPWKQQQQKNISNMSSFLKALSATEESCEGILNKNGAMTDSKGESWDKSALRSIQRELSEFSSDYHNNIKGSLPSGKSSKTKNGKSSVKLRKLNVKNFFLHSEFSPFQTWGDFNRFPFGQEDTVLTTDNIPKWYDMPFYKELTEAHRNKTLQTEEAPSCQKVPIEPPPPTAPKPIPPCPPPKVLPKPSATPAAKRCSSDGGDGSSAPWRRNRSRAKSVIPANQSGMPPQENSLKTVDESLSLVKKEVRSVEVKAIEEVSSLASTPFSICQLMTPLIPSRQPTETSEILQGVLSPSALDLPLRPHSEAKLTPEPPVKRDSYKSLASSILFNLKDNRKRVKSRYSPPKFKTSEVPGAGTQSPQSDYMKHPHAGSEGYASGLSTPAILKDGQTVCSPVLESYSTPAVALIKHDPDRPLSEDYLLSNLLQTKRDAAGNISLGDENPIYQKTKSPMAKKQNYPSLNLYKKASPVDSDMKYLPVPLSTFAPIHIDQPPETNELSPLVLNNEFSPKVPPTNTGFSPKSLNVNSDRSPIISPRALEKEGLSSNVSVGKIPSNVPDKAKQPSKDIKEKYSGVQPVSGQPLSTKDVIRAAREAISAAKSRARSSTQSESSSKPISDIEELKVKEIDESGAYSKESSKSEAAVAENNNATSQNRNEATGATLVGKKGHVKKEPPPVPKRSFVKSDIQIPLDKQQMHHVEKLTNGANSPPDENETVQKQGKLKHIFSARQNNYIKSQRYSVTDEQRGEEFDEGNLKVRTETDEKVISQQDMRDSEHIINDLNDLKELERAKLGDRVLDNAKNKLAVLNIEEEARVKNDLISRELRNIKRGMLSMRGNTSAKRELFLNVEKEQHKQDAFAKIDSNVIVNKALLNDNYDKAKMALEEIISERQKKRNDSTEQDANPEFDTNASDKSYVTRHRKASLRDPTAEDKKKYNDSIQTLKENDLKERLGDLRDHNHMRQIMSQTEPGRGQTDMTAARMALPGTLSKINHPNDKPINSPCSESADVNLRHLVRQTSEESGENLICHDEDKKGDAPPVPPRSKKGGNRRDASVTQETDSCKDLVIEEDIFDKGGKQENDEVNLKHMGSTEESDLPTNEFCPNQNETSSEGLRCDVLNNEDSKSITATDSVIWDSVLPSTCPQSSENISPVIRGNENKANNLTVDISPNMEATFKNGSVVAPEMYKEKQKADHSNATYNNVNLMAEESDKMNSASEEMNVDAEALSETPRDIISPLLLVNGISINQSPPDQASLSSKSSYFSVESTVHRNIETESNVYHSLENLIGEVDEVDEVDEVEEAMQNISQDIKQDSDRMEVEYYSLSDHDSEPEVVKCRLKSPQKETIVPRKDSREEENTIIDQGANHDGNNQTPMSPSNTFPPPLGIPALFKVKDNTFSNKLKKTVQPWSPRGSLSGSERGEEEFHLMKEDPELLPVNEPATSVSVPIPDESLIPKDILSNSAPPLLPAFPNMQSENQQKPQFGGFLTVPQEEDRFSGVSPSSEGVESFTTSAADTADELGMNVGVPGEREVSKVPSERSGSTCSGNESQAGLPKPPAVLPKSEKAVLKAIKLANRRMKKEEAQKSSHKSSQSSSKQRAERHKSDKSEHKGNSSSRSSKVSRGKTEDGNHHSQSRGKMDDQSEPQLDDRRGHTTEKHHGDRTDVAHKNRRQSYDSVDSNAHNNEAPPGVAPERHGRSSNRHTRDKPEQRHYSSERIISNVPVYKAHTGDRAPTDRPFHRSQSIDRYLGDKVERRLSTDMSEKLDPRTQRIEKSIMDELQQRGRARDKPSRENPLRRSHSIDAYSAEVPQPSTLSRQSSLTSQLSRQSSIEHAIVTQSFPMTQRKLLQDPDSGQYYFVDMPVQVKTKTFFDPETGSYVQLPVQPPDGAVPQPSPLEVLTPPMLVYHSFVPVPLSPMAQKATIQAPYLAPEEFEQRHLERSRQMHCKERHPYLEPVYAQHDHMLGEYLGTEELNCPS